MKIVWYGLNTAEYFGNRQKDIKDNAEEKLYFRESGECEKHFQLQMTDGLSSLSLSFVAVDVDSFCVTRTKNKAPVINGL